MELIAALAAENARLRAVLAQYADVGNWCFPDDGALGMVYWIGQGEHGFTLARREE